MNQKVVKKKRGFNRIPKFGVSLESKRGFTLLTAIVVTSMLLLVSFVVANIALKQLIIAYAGQESQYSFYNADSGLECAMYNDLKKSPSSFETLTGGTVDCNGQSIGETETVNTIPSQMSHVGNGAGVLTNYALAGTASAVPSNNEYNNGLFPASSVINAASDGSSWGNNGGWNDNSIGGYPDTIQVAFSGSKTLSEIDVYTLPNGYNTVPTASATDYGISDFVVQTCDFSNVCTTIPSVGTVTNNTLAKKQITLSPAIPGVYAIRVVVNAVNNAGGAGDYSRIVRLEAWGGNVGSSESSIFQLNFPHGCAIVTVTKSGSNTLIESRGYNTCDTNSDRRFERGIKIQY